MLQWHIFTNVISGLQCHGSLKFECISVKWFQSFFKQILLKTKSGEKSDPSYIYIYIYIYIKDISKAERF